MIEKYREIFGDYSSPTKRDEKYDLPFLSEGDWELLTRNAKKLKFNKGDIIFKEGEMLKNLFRIVTGKIDVRRKGESQYTLINLDFFGEYSFFSKYQSAGKKKCKKKKN